MKNTIDPGAQIKEVIPGSIADEIGLNPGDIIVAINGRRPRDYIDYRYLIAADELELQVSRADGEEWLVEIDKDYDDDLGVVFTSDTFDGIKRCRNKCLFCFVDQMPPGLRPSLYLKDDDYRLSFLHGNFITLTNLKPEDVERIIHDHLSPLYVSVHTTEARLRESMLRNPEAGRSLALLHTLARNGITIHTQIVLCPGWNDGSHLKETVRDLAALWPGVRSVAVVPVGVTRFRPPRDHIRPLSVQEARDVVSWSKKMQEQFRLDFGYTFLFLADEIYLKAGTELPPYEEYEDFPQLENGVGMARLFLTEAAEVLQNMPGLLKKQHLTVVTGQSAYHLLAGFAGRLNALQHTQLHVIGIENHFFGTTVTVAGLVVGKDIQNQLQGQDLGEGVLLPAVMFKKGERVFLDGMSADELSRVLGVPVYIIDPTPHALISVLTT